MRQQNIILTINRQILGYLLYLLRRLSKKISNLQRKISLRHYSDPQRAPKPYAKGAKPGPKLKMQKSSEVDAETKGTKSKSSSTNAQLQGCLTLELISYVWHFRGKISRCQDSLLQQALLKGAVEIILLVFCYTQRGELAIC